MDGVVVGQEDSKEAAHQVQSIIEQLRSEEAGAVLLEPSAKRYVGGEYPQLGLAGYLPDNVDREAMYFVPCDGGLRRVDVNDLRDTDEECQSGIEDPVTVRLSFSGGSVGALAAVSAEADPFWSEGNFRSWLAAVKAGASLDMQNDQAAVENADAMVVTKYKFGDQEVLAVRLILNPAAPPQGDP